MLAIAQWGESWITGGSGGSHLLNSAIQGFSPVNVADASFQVTVAVKSDKCPAQLTEVRQVVMDRGRGST